MEWAEMVPHLLLEGNSVSRVERATEVNACDGRRYRRSRLERAGIADSSMTGCFFRYGPGRRQKHSGSKSACFTDAVLSAPIQGEHSSAPMLLDQLHRFRT